MNWTTLISNPLAITIVGGVVVLFIGWLFKNAFNTRRATEETIQQNTSQNFQPTIHINTAGTVPVLPYGKTSFQAAQERNAISGEEAKEHRLGRLEHQLDICMVDIQLIHTSNENEFVQKMHSAISDVKVFFEIHPELRPLNLELLKPLVSGDFYQQLKQEARIEWANIRYAKPEKQHPCEVLVNDMVEHLLLLRVRPERTMKDYRTTLPK